MAQQPQPSVCPCCDPIAGSGLTARCTCGGGTGVDLNALRARVDLDHAEALANAATPGPWFNDSHEIYAGPHTDIPAMNEWIGETCDPNRPDHGAANAALAAWSRDGVPALVAEIRRLTAGSTGPCPISPCDWDLNGTLDDHLYCEHETEDLVAAVVRLALANDRLRAELDTDAQQTWQQAAERVATELGSIDPAEWAFAGQHAGNDAIRIAKAVGARCNCPATGKPGHYIDHLTTPAPSGA